MKLKLIAAAVIVTLTWGGWHYITALQDERDAFMISDAKKSDALKGWETTYASLKENEAVNARLLSQRAADNAALRGRTDQLKWRLADVIDKESAAHPCLVTDMPDAVVDLLRKQPAGGDYKADAHPHETTGDTDDGHAAAGARG